MMHAAMLGLDMQSTAEEFCKFMDEHPTVFHFVAGVSEMLSNAGFIEYNERDTPKLERGGKYFVQRNQSTLIAFEIGEDFVPGPDGYSIIESHIDANRLCLKPTSLEHDVEGYLRLGSAFYGGANASTWWDRDLGIGGRVVYRTMSGKIHTKLVRIPGTIGSIPSLAPHFGADISSILRANLETNMVPVVSPFFELDPPATKEETASPLAKKHPLQLLRAIAKETHCQVSDLLEMDLELFSDEKAKIAGLDNNLLYCSRMDDRLCSYTAVKALISSKLGHKHSTAVVALYDNEEIGSKSRTGALNHLLENVFDDVSRSLYATKDDKFQSLANSLALSADVTHAVNPNYVSAYAAEHMPRLNTGMTIKRLGRFTSNGVDAALCHRVSSESGIKLQMFAPRSDTASGSTIGPFRAALSGIQTIDVGIPILSMHSIRETTGSKDIALGINWFKTFFDLADELTNSTNSI